MTETAPGSENPPVIPEKLFVCTGVRLKANSKTDLLIGFDELGDGDERGKERLFTFARSMAYYHAGAVYSIECPTETTIYPKSGRFVRRYEDGALTASWEALSEAAQASADAEKLRKRETARLRALLVALRPLRSEYARALPRQRTALEVLVLEALRRRPERDESDE